MDAAPRTVERGTGMKRIIAAILTMLLVVGCAKVEKAQEIEKRVNVTRFVQVENAGTWQVVADRETGVMYAVSAGTYNLGTFTLLVDADGKPLLWKGGQNE